MIPASLIIWALIGKVFAINFFMVALIGIIITSILHIWYIPGNLALCSLTDFHIMDGTATISEKLGKACFAFISQLVLLSGKLFIILFIITIIITYIQK